MHDVIDLEQHIDSKKKQLEDYYTINGDLYMVYEDYTQKSVFKLYAVKINLNDGENASFEKKNKTHAV